MIEPGKPAKLTDVELVEALELAAARIRMASTEDLRHVGDAIAGLAIEGAGRLRDVLELMPTIDIGAAGQRVLASIARGDRGYGQAPAVQGPMLGKIRRVVLHPDGRLTCELEINDAGRQIVEQVKRAAGVDGPGFRS